MPHKWKVFIIVNYFFAAIYSFLCLSSMSMSAHVVKQEEQTAFTPYIIIPFLLLINVVFNIAVYHRHLPDKPMGDTKVFFYKSSAFIYLLSLTIMLISMFSAVTEKSGTDDGFSRFILIFFIVNLAGGFFIFINQLQLNTFINSQSEKNEEGTQKDQVD